MMWPCRVTTSEGATTAIHGSTAKAADTSAAPAAAAAALPALSRRPRVGAAAAPAELESAAVATVPAALPPVCDTDDRFDRGGRPDEGPVPALSLPVGPLSDSDVSLTAPPAHAATTVTGSVPARCKDGGSGGAAASALGTCAAASGSPSASARASAAIAWTDVVFAMAAMSASMPSLPSASVPAVLSAEAAAPPVVSVEVLRIGPSSSSW